MPRGLAGDANDMDVGIDGVFRDFLGRLKQRADVDIETEIGKGGSYDFGASVVTVLAHLCHQHARTTALMLGKTLHFAANGGKFVVAFILRAVDAGDRADFGTVSAKYAFHRVGNFADRGASTRRFDRQLEKI